MPAPIDLRCAYAALVELLAVIDRRPVPDELPSCDEVAAFSVGVVRKRPGQDVEIWTQVCHGHERPASLTPGYARSIPLRVPKPT